MDALVTSPDSGAAVESAPRSAELDGRDLERLRAAGAGARLAVGVGSVGLGLLALQWLDVGLKNPYAFGLFTVTTILSGAASFIASLAAIVLFWAFGRNVSAHFASGDRALERAFRHLRSYFVLWTCLAVVSALMILVELWRAL